MIVENEYKPKSKKTGLLYYGIIIVVFFLVTALIVSQMINSLGVNHYWGPGSNTEVFGAPDGVYKQKDWGSFDNATLQWTFAMCDHDYLGPLHGSWKAAPDVSFLDWHDYPEDSSLFLRLENNIIIEAWVIYAN